MVQHPGLHRNDFGASRQPEIHARRVGRARVRLKVEYDMEDLRKLWRQRMSKLDAELQQELCRTYERMSERMEAERRHE
ncbi:MAG TPA: hypothetical protein VHZ55_25640 [Bryobacteraceae bacterium]|jgi:hypothetical protein|nr:hypothetical protein [Bryobacteraceae bacterium]